MAYEQLGFFQLKMPKLKLNVGETLKQFMPEGVQRALAERPDWMKKVQIKVKPRELPRQALGVLKVLAPTEAAKFEQYVQAEATEAGKGYALEKVKEAAANPVVWIAGGVAALIIVGQLIGRRR